MLLVFVIVSVGIRTGFAFEDDGGGFEGFEFVLNGEAATSVLSLLSV